MSEYIIQDATLSSIADAIRAKTGGIAQMTPEQMATEIGNIKCIVPIIDIPYASNYTVADAELSVSFTYGNAGDTHLAIFALRYYEEMPTIPDGWECIAWIPYNSTDSSKQSLLVLRHIVSSDEANTSASVGLSTVAGQRNYEMVLNLGDTGIDTSDIITLKQADVSTVEFELFEHTLLIGSSSSANADYYGSAWVNSNEGYVDKIMPDYNDGYAVGGRLAAFYVPYKSQQPFEKLNLQIMEPSGTTDLLCCTFNLKVGTPSKYFTFLIPNKT